MHFRHELTHAAAPAADFEMSAHPAFRERVGEASPDVWPTPTDEGSRVARSTRAAGGR